MRLFLIICTALVFGMGVPVSAQTNHTERIATIVNEDVISFSDVSDRMLLVLISSGLPDNPDIREKLLPQVVASLIDEQLMLQEANRLEISVSSEEINGAFSQVAEQNDMPPEKFKDVLRRSGIDLRTMERQIESQIAWQKVIQAELSRRVNVSESDVKAVMDRLQASRGKTEYLAAEIFLPIDEPEQAQNVRNLAQKLAGQAQSGEGAFYKIAQQFSKAAGSAQGGDIGWIQEGDLPEELDKIVTRLDKDQISGAVRSLSGYHIFYVRDKRIVTEDNLPTPEQIGQTLANERLERIQRRHLMDLRSAAFIEKRV